MVSSPPLNLSFDFPHSQNYHLSYRITPQGSTMTDRTFTPGPTPNTVRSADGKVLTVPEGWVLLSPGDAALTRRVKEAGDHCVVQEKKGRKVFSRGVWAPAATIDGIG